MCLSDVGDYKGVKVKIGNSYIIRQHLEVRDARLMLMSVTFNHVLMKICCFVLQRALELNSKDATSFHILGYW